MSTTGENRQHVPKPRKKRTKKPVYITIPLGMSLFGLMDVHTHKVYETVYLSRAEARQAGDRLGDPHVTVTETWT
jgi:hypothetical protein